MLGRIAGVRVDSPPPALLGRFLAAGRPDALIAWLNGEAAKPQIKAFAVSTDMLAYGGLTASRVPGPSYADAYFRLRELGHLRARSARSWIGAFGTIMRLAPTGIPAGTPFFAPYPVWSYLQEYANLHYPPLPSEAARAERLRNLIGPATLEGYLVTRARNLAVDRLLLSMTAAGHHRSACPGARRCRSGRIACARRTTSAGRTRLWRAAGARIDRARSRRARHRVSRARHCSRSKVDPAHSGSIFQARWRALSRPDRIRAGLDGNRRVDTGVRRSARRRSPGHLALRARSK